MCDYVVTDEEIALAEKAVLGDDKHFNRKQTEFIKCLDSCFLQAYAGTGKTTTLVGKLHVLSQKQVWNDGKGICIISHTNVAIDEVRKHVAVHYPGIMDYPNFIGTLQDFANTFLFSPHIAEKGLRIKLQDESFPYSHNWGILNKYDNEVRNAITSAHRSYSEHGLFNRILLENGEVHLKEKPFPLEQINSKRSTKKVPDSALDSINRYFTEIIENRRSSGRFYFEESFIDGLERISRYPMLSKILARRFRYVFLDEAQDCSKYQLDLLNQVFTSGDSVFQQIGDTNQSITQNEWTPANPCMYLGESKRLGSNIVSTINKYRVDDGDGLVGSNHETSQVLITYSEGNESSVLDKFIEVIQSKEVLAEDGLGFHAIACRKEPLITLDDTYSPQAPKLKGNSKFPNFENDIDYINLLSKDIVKKYGSNFVANTLFKLLYKYYKAQGQWYELKSDLREGESSERFRRLVLNVTQQLIMDETVDVNLIEGELNAVLGEQSISFEGQQFNNTGSSVANGNVYCSGFIQVTLGSVASVKGQTHNATMLFSIRGDGNQDFEHAIKNTQVMTPRYKKLLYVAASRPKDLFVTAISNEAYAALTDKSVFDDFEKIFIL